MDTLLCPITDFPYMLAACVPTRELLLLTAMIPLAALVWEAVQRRRKRITFSEVTVSGRVAGPGGRGALVLDTRSSHYREPRLLLQTSTGQVPVEIGEATLIGRRCLRVGDRVTALGLEGLVPRGREALYREAHAEPGIEAIELLAQRHSATWLASLLLIGGWCVFAAVLVAKTS